MGLIINANYDTSVTSLQTSNPTLYSEYTNAVQHAIQAFENLIVTSVTVSINFGWGEVNGSPISPGASGESSTYQDTYSYSTLYNAVKATETTSAVQVAAVASLPATDPTGGATFSIATAEAAALGLDTSGQNIGGFVGLDSSTNWSWTQSSVPAGTEDAIGTLEHEISEVLGRSATGGANGQYSLLDMFRYTAADGQSTDPIGAAAGARDEPFAGGYSANAPSYFSYNGQTVTQLFENPTDVSGGADVADWDPSVNNDAFGDGPSGQVDQITTTDQQVLNVLGYQLACYCRGTRIMARDSAVAVEDLRPGDLVATQRNGETVLRPIVWVGHRRIDLTRHPRPQTASPVRIRQGAFADGVPQRDLLVSPDHAIFVDGKLIAVRQLVNGATIRVEQGLASVEYFHIELEEHGLLLAEGLAAESYLDTGNRGVFADSDAPYVLHPDMAGSAGFADRERASCHPFVWDEASVRPAWQRLAERASQLEPPLPLQAVCTDPDIHLIVQGRTIWPSGNAGSGRYCFVVPQGSDVVRLVSRAAAPTDTRPWLEDRRELGIYVSAIRLRDSAGRRELPLDHPGLRGGWWAAERHGLAFRRWTNGDAVLRLPHAAGPLVLEIEAGTCGMEYPAAENEWRAIA